MKKKLEEIKEEKQVGTFLLKQNGKKHQMQHLEYGQLIARPTSLKNKD